MASGATPADPLHFERNWFINSEFNVKVVIKKGTKATLKDLGVLRNVGFSGKFKRTGKLTMPIVKITVKNNKCYALQPKKLKDLDGRMHPEFKELVDSSLTNTAVASKCLFCNNVLCVCA
jgi:hypothetical protein